MTHGLPIEIVTRSDLLRAGLSGRGVAQAVASGTLRRLAPGVYANGPLPADPIDRWYEQAAVAVIRCGPDSALGGAAAAALWDWDGFELPVELTVAITHSQRRRHPAARRIGRIGDPGTRHGLPVTSACQTLLDLGIGLAPRRTQSPSGHVGQLLTAADQVELALECALRRGDGREAELLELVGTLPRGRRGVAVLDEVLQRRPPGQPATESYLETRCVQVLRNAGLPTGARQVDILDDRARFVGRVDFQLSSRVIVEVDGREHHGEDRHEADRRRWSRLSALGYGLAVFTWAQIEFQPTYVANLVRDLLENHRIDVDSTDTPWGTRSDSTSIRQNRRGR